MEGGQVGGLLPQAVYAVPAPAGKGGGGVLTVSKVMKRIL
jgi:hypothetical protein